MSFTPTAYTAPDFTTDTLKNAPEVRLVPAPADFVLPQGYHATSIYPEFYHKDGRWQLAADTRMDCAVVYANGQWKVLEFRHVKKGDLVVVGRTEDGSEGIYVHGSAFSGGEGCGDAFAFRTGRSRETAFSIEYDQLCELLRYEKENGYIVWVMGPACSFDAGSRRAFEGLVAGGYVNALLAGNALATHDLEACLCNTALGVDVYTQQGMHNGHYNHMDAINAVRAAGSIEAFVKQNGYTQGIVSACVNHNVPMVLAGSIRDDGPLPGVIPDVYTAQDEMRSHLRRATTLVCMASTLHSVAAGNITPSFRQLPNGSLRPVYFYAVDVAEFAVNKLADRGSLAARGIVTNVQDFVVKLSKGLDTYPQE